MDLDDDDSVEYVVQNGNDEEYDDQNSKQSLHHTTVLVYSNGLKSRSQWSQIDSRLKLTLGLRQLKS